MTASESGESHESAHGTVAHDVVGDGDPIVPLRGTPSSSHSWRDVLAALRNDRTLYLFDLAGVGQSDRVESHDVPLAAHGAGLAGLVGVRNPDGFGVAGHGSGGATTRRARLPRDVQYRSISGPNGAVHAPWTVPRSFSKRARDHVGPFRAVTADTRGLLMDRLATALYRAVDEAASDPDPTPWHGDTGRLAAHRQAAGVGARHADGSGDAHSSVSEPTSGSWGVPDEDLDAEGRQRVDGQVPSSERVEPDAAGGSTPGGAPPTTGTDSLDGVFC